MAAVFDAEVTAQIPLLSGRWFYKKKFSHKKVSSFLLAFEVVYLCFSSLVPTAPPRAPPEEATAKFLVSFSEIVEGNYQVNTVGGMFFSLSVKTTRKSCLAFFFAGSSNTPFCVSHEKISTPFTPFKWWFVFIFSRKGLEACASRLRVSEFAHIFRACRCVFAIICVYDMRR